MLGMDYFAKTGTDGTDNPYHLNVFPVQHRYVCRGRSTVAFLHVPVYTFNTMQSEVCMGEESGNTSGQGTGIVKEVALWLDI